eukprot:tig00000254_g22493.t1
MCCEFDPRVVVYLDRAGDAVFSLMGPTLIAAAVVLLLGATYTFFWVIFSQFIDAYTPFGAALFVVCVFIAFNVYFNYFMAIRTDPGRPREELCDPTAAAESGEACVESDPRAGRFSRYCRKCRAPKPPRTHHCSVCRRCVLKMDHHCPWINNCVGFYNQRYFVLFLVYIWLGALICTVASGAIFTSRTRFARLPDHNARTCVIFVMIAAMSCWAGVSFMLAWHMYLLSTGQTTIEFYSNRERAAAARRRGEAGGNEYDLGCRLNLRDAFGAGRFPWSWLMPSLGPPPGDGHSFPTLRGLARSELRAEEAGRQQPLVFGQAPGPASASAQAQAQAQAAYSAAIEALVGVVAPAGAHRIALKEQHSA